MTREQAIQKIKKLLGEGAGWNVGRQGISGPELRKKAHAEREKIAAERALAEAEIAYAQVEGEKLAQELFEANAEMWKSVDRFLEAFEVPGEINVVRAQWGITAMLESELMGMRMVADGARRRLAEQGIQVTPSISSISQDSDAGAIFARLEGLIRQLENLQRIRLGR